MARTRLEEIQDDVASAHPVQREAFSVFIAVRRADVGRDGSERAAGKLATFQAELGQRLSTRWSRAQDDHA